MPDTIAERVLKYADAFRAGAMFGTTASANSANASVIAAKQMTYGQAVLWLDPLLATIDEGNKRFEAIRAAGGVKSNSGNFKFEQISEGAVLLTYKSFQRDAQGRAVRCTERSSIWLLKDKEGWQMRFHQGTPTDD